MIFLYNIITLLLVPLLALFLPIYLIFRPEKRHILPQRLGFGLKLPSNRKKSTVWIHALSVGEVTSACHLVKQLYQDKHKSTTIIFSTTTVSGYEVAKKIIRPYSDCLIYSPLDFLPVVNFFLKKIQPDLFILIETDFWPNLLHRLAKFDAQLLLINGRVSDRSMERYQRFSLFFSPLFDTFTLLCMQTKDDARKMLRLGINEEKVKTVGNLKFGGQDLPEPETVSQKQFFPAGNLIILAGSTHAGEEQTIIDVFLNLKRSVSQPLHLVVAPRNISRCQEIIELFENNNLTYTNFSSNNSYEVIDVTIIDTIGDLSSLYRYADISFIGGSLVNEGGHNPLEASRCGCPVLFGPYMDDFSEISTGLLEAGGALEVQDPSSLYDILQLLIHDETKRKVIGQKALSYTTEHKHVISGHLELIDRYL